MVVRRLPRFYHEGRRECSRPSTPEKGNCTSCDTTQERGDQNCGTEEERLRLAGLGSLWLVILLLPEFLTLILYLQCKLYGKKVCGMQWLGVLGIRPLDIFRGLRGETGVWRWISRRVGFALVSFPIFVIIIPIISGCWMVVRQALMGEQRKQCWTGSRITCGTSELWNPSLTLSKESIM